MAQFKQGDRVEYIGEGFSNGRTGTVADSRDLTPDFQVRVTWDDGNILFSTPLIKNLRHLSARKQQTVRARVLDEAKRITATDRNSAYGEPEDNFQRIADFWNVWLQDKLKADVKLSPSDTAALMILVKMAREMNAPTEDNKVDGAGYFACWAEVDSK